MAFLKAQIRNHYWITCWLMESWVLMTDWPSISKSIQKSQSSNSSLNDLSIQNGKEILHERPTQWLFGRWISKISARPTSPHQKHEVRFNLNLVARRPVVRLCETETIRSIFVSYIWWTTWWFPNVSKMFYFPLGKWSILTNIFQMGWFNHQLEWRYFRIYLKLLIPNCPKSHLLIF